MSKLSEIHAAVNSERPYYPYVRFLKDIKKIECYPEEGMYAQIIGCEIEGHEDDGLPYYKVTFNFAPFDSFNKSKETSKYYNKEGNPVLTAREANFYSAVDHFYLNDQDECVQTVREDEETLPFEDINDLKMIEILRSFGYGRIEDNIDIESQALRCFANGDVRSEMAAFLRVWVLSKIKKGEYE